MSARTYNDDNVTPTFPTKRELKQSGNLVEYAVDSLSYTHLPYEEGTETVAEMATIVNGDQVTPTFPTKRELKQHFAAAISN